MYQKEKNPDPPPYPLKNEKKSFLKKINPLPLLLNSKKNQNK
jgi:hypothetical protein